MATISIKETYASKEGPDISEGPKRVYRRRWTAVADSIVTGDKVLAKVGVGLGSTYNKFPGTWCTSIKPKQDGSDYVWRIEAEYTSVTASNQDPDQPEEPLLRPPEINFSTERAEMYLPHDMDEKPFVNEPRKEKLDPPPTHYSLFRISITRNFPTVSVAQLRAYVPAVNQDNFQVGGFGQIPKGYGLMDGISATPQFEAGLSYWRVSFEILTNPNKWIPFKLLNEGRVFRRDALDPDYKEGEGWVLVRDDNDVSYSDMVPIDHQGFKAGAFGHDFHWLEFRLFPWANFGALGIFNPTP